MGKQNVQAEKVYWMQTVRKSSERELQYIQGIQVIERGQGCKTQ